MTEERWQHALEKRPWLEPYLGEVLATIRQGRRQQDPLNQRKYKYYWPCSELRPDFNHLVVIVVFDQQLGEMNQFSTNNYVTNVWAVYLYGKR